MSLLILGGTSEGRILAEALANCPDARIAMAGTTEHPEKQALPVHRGGFGGQAGLEAYLRSEGITAVLDATHPFAAQMTRHARAACDAEDVAYLQLLRPPWYPLPGETWTRVSDVSGAVGAIGAGATVLWTAGRKDLQALGGLERARVIIRLVDPPQRACPLPRGKFIVARPPFSLPEEIALMRREKIDTLVAKNSGGGAGRSKLTAARQLGVRIILIERPAGPKDRVVETLDEAIAWGEAKASR